MNRQRQQLAAETFRSLHAGPRALLLPNAWDAMSARVFAAAGFPAVATTSAGFAWALGYPDGERVPRDTMLAAVALIVRAARVPVTVDLEAGYGATAAALADTIRAVIDAGAVGVNLEDGVGGHGGTLRSLAEAADRIRTARNTAIAGGAALFINARTDLYLSPAADERARFDDAVARGRAYLQAGADCVYPIGLSEPRAIAEFVRAVKAPVNVMGRSGLPSLAELEAIGVRRVSTATGPALKTLETIQGVARELLASGRFDVLKAGISYADAQRLFSDP